MTVTAGLFEHILPLVPGLDARLEDGIEVLDAGCGQGSALIALAGRFPRSRFIGYDLAEEAVAHATELARRAGLENVTFEARDLTGYHERARFDVVTSFDAVHDQKDPAALIRGLHGALKPGGVYLMQDIGGSARLENNLDFPMASFLYAISCAHCTPVSLGQGGEGLGTMWGWETAQVRRPALGAAQSPPRRRRADRDRDAAATAGPAARHGGDRLGRPPRARPLSRPSALHRDRDPARRPARPSRLCGRRRRLGPSGRTDQPRQTKAIRKAIAISAP